MLSTSLYFFLQILDEVNSEGARGEIESEDSEVESEVEENVEATSESVCVYMFVSTQFWVITNNSFSKFQGHHITLSQDCF